MLLWKKILVASVSFWGLTAVPLLLYMVFGPDDGNPIGLGLLYLAGQMLGLAGIAVGLILYLRQAMRRKGADSSK